MNDFNTKSIKTLSELFERLETNSIYYQKYLIEKAYEFITNVHKDVARQSGDSLVEHCLSVAAYIADLKLDQTSVIAALLHDTVDKGNISIDEIDSKFGTEVAFIIDGVSSARQLSKQYDSEQQHNLDFTNLIFSSCEDIRIILIRICEKMHNIFNLGGMDKDYAKTAADKILKIYVPIAEYLGLGVIQRTLEDKAFEILNPTEFNKITDASSEFLKQSRSAINKFEKDVKEILENHGIAKSEIKARRKGVYSAFKKIKYKYMAKGDDFETALSKLKDIYAARILVENVEQCYMVLGLLQSKYEPELDEFRDYIANPKDNGYKSIHSILKYEAITVEVQVRTFEMDEYNEYGPACHIAYKLKNQGIAAKEETLTWTKDLATWKEKGNKSREHFQIKAFQNSIFCFTPKGLVIRLEKDSSPLEFAFRVHTGLGLKYQGALVNNKMVAMNYKLKTGDVVQIIQGHKINVSRDWTKFIKSTAIKGHVRKALKE